MITVTQDEWVLAKKMLANIKARAERRNETLPLTFCLRTHRESKQLKHNFQYFKDGDKDILLCSEQDVYLGFGGFGKVKLAVDEYGQKYKIKEHQFCTSSMQAKIKKNRVRLNLHKRAALKALDRLYLNIEHQHTTEQTDPISFQPYDYSFYEIQHYQEGITLQQYLRSAELSLAQREAIAYALTTIVLNMHKHHVVHGDLKPQNIIYDPETGRFSLIDFDGATFFKTEKSIDYWVKHRCRSRYYSSTKLSDRQHLQNFDQCKQEDIYGLGKILERDLKLTDHCIKSMVASQADNRPNLLSVQSYFHKEAETRLAEPKLAHGQYREIEKIYKRCKTNNANKKTMLIIVQSHVRTIDTADELNAAFIKLHQLEYLDPFLRRERKYPWTAGTTTSWGKMVKIFKQRSLEIAADQLTPNSNTAPFERETFVNLLKIKTRRIPPWGRTRSLRQLDDMIADANLKSEACLSTQHRPAL